jgi:hypothetical protein
MFEGRPAAGLLALSRSSMADSKTRFLLSPAVLRNRNNCGSACELGKRPTTSTCTAVLGALPMLGPARGLP